MSKTAKKPLTFLNTGKITTKMSQKQQNNEKFPKNKKIPTKKSKNRKETVKKILNNL